jgi:hypothetical protein
MIYSASVRKTEFENMEWMTKSFQAVAEETFRSPLKRYFSLFHEKGRWFSC